MTDLTPKPAVPPAPPEFIAPLLERFPACFDWQDPKPLKIGINQDLLGSGALGEGCDAKALRRMLAGYCARPRYLKTLKEGAVRVDLQGHPAGAVSAADADNARERLAARAARKAGWPPPERSACADPHPADAARASDDTPLPEENLVPGRLELTVKFSELPRPLTVQSGVKIGIETGEGTVTAILPPKVWRKLEQASKDYPQWVAALSGSLERFAGSEIALKNPAMQVFEKKAKPAAEPGESAIAAPRPPAATPEPPIGNRAPAPPAEPAHPTIARATLSLKGKTVKTD